MTGEERKAARALCQPHAVNGEASAIRLWEATQVALSEALDHSVELEGQINEATAILKVGWAEPGRGPGLMAEATRMRRTVSAYDAAVNGHPDTSLRVAFAHASIERHNGFTDMERQVLRKTELLARCRVVLEEARWTGGKSDAFCKALAELLEDIEKES